MGQCASARANHGVHPRPTIRRRSSIRSATGSVRWSFSKKRPAKRKQSAAPHVSGELLSLDKTDVNAATEEELMTISGIDRPLAKNIVNYRDLIGGFRRVEDVALVSGLGAAKFAAIRDEICVGSRRRKLSFSSSNSASNPEQKSVSSVSGIEMTAPTRLVDLNQATMFDLMSIRGLNQELAANIIYHREKKGPFRNVDDLKRVKGISRRRTALLKNFLTVDEPNLLPVSSDSSFPTLGCSSPQTTPRIIPKRSSPKSRRFARHRRTKSAPTKLSELVNLGIGNSAAGVLHLELPASYSSSRTGGQGADHASSPADINRQIYDLMSMKSWPRPIMEEVFLDMRKGYSAFRLATWNLHALSPDKVENPGVREVVCRTILENGLTLVAVQEISCLAVLEKICQELNAPTLRKVVEWDGPRGDWRCWIDSPEAGSEEADWVQRGLRGRFRIRDQTCFSQCDTAHTKCDHVGFLYDTSRGIRLRSAKPFLCLHAGNSSNFRTSEGKRRTSFHQPEAVNPANLEYRLAVGNFELEGLELCLVTAHIRPWAAMKRSSSFRRRDRRSSSLAKPAAAVCDSAAADHAGDSPVKSEKDSADTTASTSPVAQLKEKILGKMDFREFRRAFSVVADGRTAEVDSQLAQARAGLCVIKDAFKSQLDVSKVVILGDMGVPLADPVFEDVQELALTSIVGSTTCTTATGRFVPKGEMRSYGNICLSEAMKIHFTGHWSIVRQGLDHLAVPRGWGWGGLVSSHCPVWAELYTGQVPEMAEMKEREEIAQEILTASALIAPAKETPNGLLPDLRTPRNGINGFNHIPPFPWVLSSEVSNVYVG